ncbi:MAG: ATP-binding protein [Gammaproteobacteria bacterium]|nr:ATP-binding protein [Gammaproteobacteria bacterium]
MQQTGLAEYGENLRLRMAALLLFAKSIEKWHPRSQIRILRVSGTELKPGSQYNVISDETVTGNIVELIEKSWPRLRPFLAIKVSLDERAKFEQTFIYPEDATREALINAITHRDYGIQNGIDIFIFTDRIEIKSPGALLSTLTLKNLEELNGAHESRNPYIAKVLRETKYIRELGEGMKRMFDLMRQSELQKPKLYSNATWFSITFYHKSSFTALEEQWLTLFSSMNLTPNQKRLVVLGIDARQISPEQIQKALGTEDTEVYRQEVTRLRNAGIFEDIRSNSQALSYSKQQRIPKKKVPRFKVIAPKGT